MATALSTNNVAIGTDYDQPSKPLDDPFEEQINVEHQHHPHAIEEEEIFHPPPQPSIEMAQDEDVLVEENVTPFYMNSGLLPMRGAMNIHSFLIQAKIWRKRFIVWASIYRRIIPMSTTFEIEVFLPHQTHTYSLS